MQLRLKTKFTLVTALVALALAAAISLFYVARLTRQVIHQADDRAQFVARQVFLQARNALTDAVEHDLAPQSDAPQAIWEYVKEALNRYNGLKSVAEGAVAHSPNVYEISIVDTTGLALFSDDVQQLGRPITRRPNLEDLLRSGLIDQIRVLYGPNRVYEVTIPFDLSGQEFGEVRVGISTALWRSEIQPELVRAGWFVLIAVLLSTLVAAVVSHFSLQPLALISTQLDQISQGQFEAVRPIGGQDELGQVSSKIDQIGQQLRGVRDIFGTLRENLTQAVSGLEDGLVLFSREGWAVLVSPGAEKFLDKKPAEMLGKRVHELFPPGHPVGYALRVVGDHLDPMESVEVRLNGASGERRVGVSVQVISEGGSRMGALMTLRDLDSLERIGSQLQVSERLAAYGRITAGVAHEVKNPLNSMRLWLENLKESLQLADAPANTSVADHPESREALSRQAVKVLDSEIDRLDRVVKTFLDFTRPVELELEEVRLGELIDEVLSVARPQIRQANVEVVRDVADGLPVVWLDRQLVMQAMLNLVLNAVDAMTGKNGTSRPAKQLTVRARRRGEAAEMTISDTGRGIAPQHHNRIFQLFFTTRPGGSGIGLATTYRIVQLHNGSIDFQSEVGRGTTFRIELPLSRPEANERKSRP